MKVTPDMDPAFGVSREGGLMPERKVSQIGENANRALGYDIYQHGDHVNYLNRSGSRTFDKLSHCLDEPVFRVTSSGLVESGTMRQALERHGIPVPQRPADVPDFYVGLSNGIDAAPVLTQNQWNLIGTSPHANSNNPYIGQFGVDEALARTPRSWVIGPQQSGTGVVFSDPSPSGLEPDEFRIKPAGRVYEPQAYDPITGQPN
jgi:hypothetical protein